MDPTDLGPYRGAVAPEAHEPTLLAQLRDLRAQLPAEQAPLGPFRRNRLMRVELACGPVAVKAFPAQGFLRSRLARRFGSKARRSWQVARAMFERGVGTPAPIAWLERWEAGRLVESYFLAEHRDAVSTLHAELIHLYREEFQYRKLLNLLETVAAAVRRMHDAGIRHGDMGNQNIFLRRTGPDSWSEVEFLDVNRGRVREGQLSLRERAFDLSRLTLPSRLRYLFSLMYYRERFFAGRRAPKAFVRWERFHRFRFWLHTVTRRVRHPVRAWRRRKLGPKRIDYPHPKDIWIWDEHTSQAIGVWTRHEKLRYLSPLGVLKMIFATLTAFLPVAIGLRVQRRRAFGRPVDLRGRIGMTLDARTETLERELDLLEPLGRIPLLVRFCHHEGPERWDVAADAVARLRERGHAVSVALVQDRRAVKDPERWRAFLLHVMERVGDKVEYAELGHAVNRVKWGIWSLREHARLLRPIRELRERWSGVKWIGPAVNDFEYHYVLSSLADLPWGQRFDALSLHLYMDRSGPPEGGQMVFSGLDKFLLPRALTKLTGRCADRVVITEVNWPLGKEGGQSHAFAPYVWIGNLKLDTTATLEAYADYMVRYYLLALCSGAIERVFWWKLVGESFGLVNDSDPGHWEKRPAYRALITLLDQLGDATFEQRVAADDGVHILRFRRSDGESVAVAWSSEGEREVALPFTARRALTRDGEETPAPDGRTALGGSPVYLLGLRGGGGETGASASGSSPGSGPVP